MPNQECNRKINDADYECWPAASPIARHTKCRWTNVVQREEAKAKPESAKKSSREHSLDQRCLLAENCQTIEGNYLLSVDYTYPHFFCWHKNCSGNYSMNPMQISGDAIQ